MLDFDGFLKYARISADDIDSVSTARDCYEAAIDAAEEAGISQKAIYESPKCAIYIYSLALHYNENRGFMPAETFDRYRKEIMTKMRNELKYSVRYQ